MTQAKREFELALSDSEELIACYDSMNNCDNDTRPPEVLKRATLIMTLTAWETYVEDVATELINAKYGMVMGSQVGCIITARLRDQLKTFNNPDSKKTKDLFQEFFGLDITESWVWGNYHTAKDARTALNAWLRKRGEAVHRAQVDKQSSHIVKRDELDKCLRFFRELVEVTDKKLSEI
ncbi:HEPN domain-containing protein [Vibrio mexicanus]|uniref:HEPN domain-containing protein n=1 Tax=Vibrio mexicanus TaxID=1004326 RepID=UPI00063CA002|nr:HEPN domain-containing protein [Vibrio mexicanus]